jgi:hypothetical protein
MALLAVSRIYRLSLAYAKLKAEPQMNIQFHPVLWMYPVTGVVSLLSDEPGNDVDHPW